MTSDVKNGSLLFQKIFPLKLISKLENNTKDDPNPHSGPIVKPDTNVF